MPIPISLRQFLEQRNSEDVSLSMPIVHTRVSALSPVTERVSPEAQRTIFGGTSTLKKPRNSELTSFSMPARESQDASIVVFDCTSRVGIVIATNVWCMVASFVHTPVRQQAYCVISFSTCPFKL